MAVPQWEHHKLDKGVSTMYFNYSWAASSHYQASKQLAKHETSKTENVPDKLVYHLPCFLLVLWSNGTPRGIQQDREDVFGWRRCRWLSDIIVVTSVGSCRYWQCQCQLRVLVQLTTTSTPHSQSVSKKTCKVPLVTEVNRRRWS